MRDHLRTELPLTALTMAIQRQRPARGVVHYSDRGLYKTEVIRRHGPWRTLEAVEFATPESVDWFNHRRLLEPIGGIPSAEAEARYYAQAEQAAMAA